MIFRKKKKNVEEEILDALDCLTVEHAKASINKDRIAESTYYLNKINIVTQEHANLLEEPIGSSIPVIVVVAHGKELVDRLVALLNEKTEPENEPPEVIQ